MRNFGQGNIGECAKNRESSQDRGAQLPNSRDHENAPELRATKPAKAQADAPEACGKRMTNCVSPGLESTAILPPKFCVTMRCTISRPRPVPLPTGLVVKNGSKIRSRSSSGIPLPWSPMLMARNPGSLQVFTSISPPSGEASIALRSEEHTSELQS